jgi:DNA-binding transcriptional MerR regulator
MSNERAWRVGDLARRTGLTVRTLHYYEEIGILVPSHRSDARHRLYSNDDVDRLLRIQSLQSLGFKLDEISACLDRSGDDLLETIDRHVSELREQIKTSEELKARLEKLADVIRARLDMPKTAWLKAIKEMRMLETYFTREQLERLAARKRAIGQDQIERDQRAVELLFADAKAQIEAGLDPRSAGARSLGRRWAELLETFALGDPAIRSSLLKMYREQNRFGFNTAIEAYLASALE